MALLPLAVTRKLPFDSVAALAPLTAGPAYTLKRVFGKTSVFSLTSGSDANLTISDTVISATNVISAGVQQVAVVREQITYSAGYVAVEYPVILTGTVPPKAYFSSDFSPSAALETLPGWTNIYGPGIMATGQGNGSVGASDGNSCNFVSTKFAGGHYVQATPLAGGGNMQIVFASPDSVGFLCLARLGYYGIDIICIGSDGVHSGEGQLTTVGYDSPDDWFSARNKVRIEYQAGAIKVYKIDPNSVTSLMWAGNTALGSGAGTPGTRVGLRIDGGQTSPRCLAGPFVAGDL